MRVPAFLLVGLIAYAVPGGHLTALLSDSSVAIRTSPITWVAVSSNGSSEALISRASSLAESFDEELSP